jgi:hypothetical protein
MKTLAFAIVALLIPLLPTTSLAGDGMRVEPGKWEYTATTQNSMLPGPKTTTMTRCITAAETSPEAFLDEAQDCELSEIESDAASMRWKMLCTNAAGQMRGETRYTSSGAAVSGTTSMTMTADGHTMTMEIQTEGRRIGPCE